LPEFYIGPHVGTIVIVGNDGVLELGQDALEEELDLGIRPVLLHIFGDQQITSLNLFQVGDLADYLKKFVLCIWPLERFDYIVACVGLVVIEQNFTSDIKVSESYLHNRVNLWIVHKVLENEQIFEVLLGN